jgi:hypothetical protein
MGEEGGKEETVSLTRGKGRYVWHGIVIHGCKRVITHDEGSHFLKGGTILGSESREPQIKTCMNDGAS